VTCKKSSDEYGTHYVVPAFVPTERKNLKHMVPRPQIDLWWDRDAKRKDDEEIILRQENGKHVDLITMTLGQAYDTLHAIACLIMDK
jgi:hypothetical protein